MDTKTVQSTLQSPISQQLYLAFELSQKQWKLGFTVGMGQRLRDARSRRETCKRCNGRFRRHATDFDYRIRSQL